MAATLTELEKQTEELEKRTTTLETRFAVAIAIAVVIGLGGAGIGTLLFKAYDQISELRAQAATLDTNIKTLGPQINSAKAAAVTAVMDAQQQAIGKMVETSKSFQIIPLGQRREIVAGAATGNNSLNCAEGETLVEVHITLGGTCHAMCEPDGRPIKAIVGKCQKLQVTTGR